jgi:hypothetical protein
MTERNRKTGQTEKPELPTWGLAIWRLTNKFSTSYRYLATYPAIEYIFIFISLLSTVQADVTQNIATSPSPDVLYQGRLQKGEGFKILSFGLRE